MLRLLERIREVKGEQECGPGLWLHAGQFTGH